MGKRDVWGEVSAGVNFFNFSQTAAAFAKVDVTVGDDLTGVGGKAGMRVNCMRFAGILWLKRPCSLSFPAMRQAREKRLGDETLAAPRSDRASRSG